MIINTLFRSLQWASKLIVHSQAWCFWLERNLWRPREGIVLESDLVRSPATRAVRCNMSHIGGCLPGNISGYIAQCVSLMIWLQQCEGSIYLSNGIVSWDTLAAAAWKHWSRDTVPMTAKACAPLPQYLPVCVHSSKLPPLTHTPWFGMAHAESFSHDHSYFRSSSMGRQFETWERVSISG